jgi:hypothetical protein
MLLLKLLLLLLFRLLSSLAELLLPHLLAKLGCSQTQLLELQLRIA